MSEEDHDKPALDTYDGFLKAAIKAYYEDGGDRVNFISLLLASREAWTVAWGEMKAPGTGKKLLTGAAGAAAVVVVLRLLLGGPIGLILTGASVASLGALYARNHKRIWAQQGRYKELIEQFRTKHTGVRTKFIEGAIDQEGRDLMMDGLMRRFLEELNVSPIQEEEEEEDSEDEEEPEDAETDEEES
jgi:hypothetical protein